MAAQARNMRLVGAVNIGSFRISALIAGVDEAGELQVLGSGHRAAKGIKRGYVTDMAAATHAVRDAIERAEKMAGVSINSVWIGCSGAGLASVVTPVEMEIGGRRIEDEDIEQLLIAARGALAADGRTVLHAQPGCYVIDGADGVINPRGLHAKRLGVEVHQVLAEGAPMRNLTEAVQNAHCDVDGVVAAPLAAGYACLTREERELGVALIEMGGAVTNVAVFAGGMLAGLTSIQRGSDDITNAVASSLGIRVLEAERIKCVSGSAMASPANNREMVRIAGSMEASDTAVARGADDSGHVARSELVAIIGAELEPLMDEITRALKDMGFAPGKGGRARPVVLTGGGAELPGLADYTQSVLGMPVRIGKAAPLRGLPEAHSVPGFSTLTGLVLYAMDDPVDIRAIGSRFTYATRSSGMASLENLWRAMKAYF